MPFLPNPFKLRDIVAKQLSDPTIPELADLPVKTGPGPVFNGETLPEPSVLVCASSVGCTDSANSDKDNQIVVYGSVEIWMITNEEEKVEEQAWALVESVQTRCEVAGVRPRIQYLNVDYVLDRGGTDPDSREKTASTLNFSVMYDNLDSTAVDREHQAL